MSNTSLISVPSKHFVLRDLLVLLLVIFCLKPATCQTLEGHYPLNGNPEDISGNSLDAIQNGGSAGEDRFGDAGGAMYFDGVDDYLQMPTDFDFQERTVSLWFNAQSLDASNGMLFNIDHPGMSYGNALMRPFSIGGTPTLRYNGGAGGIGTVGEITINEGQWYLATLVMGVDSLWYYLDCELVGSAVNLNGTSVDGTTFMVVGTDRDFNPFYEGLIDDVRIYNGVLNPSTVCELYNENPDCDLVAQFELSNPCELEPVSPSNLSLVDSDGDYTYTWSSLGLDADYLGEEPTLVFNDPGEYLLELVIVDNENEGCASTYSLNLVVDETPTFDIIAPSTVCEGQEFQISSEPQWMSITWENIQIDDQGISILDESVLATATATNGSCSYSSSFSIEVLSFPTGVISGPSIVCSGIPYEYSVETNATEVLWSNGSTEWTIEGVFAESAGLGVELSQGNCIAQIDFPVEVLSPPDVDLLAPLEYCLGQVVSLTASGAETYLWSTGHALESIDIVLQTDTLIWVEGTNMCGADSAEVTIEGVESSLVQLSSMEYEIQFGEYFEFHLNLDYDFSLYSSEGLVCSNCQGYTYQVFSDESYILVYEDAFGCKGEDSVNVDMIPCSPLWIANTFSPNGDLVNDDFKPITDDHCLSNYLFIVYDRWGKEVFRSGELNESWKGGFLNTGEYFLQDEIYNWYVQYRYQGESETKEKRGFVTLIR